MRMLCADCNLKETGRKERSSGLTSMEAAPGDLREVAPSGCFTCDNRPAVRLDNLE